MKDIVTNTKVTRSTLYGLQQGIPLIIHQGGMYSGKTFNILMALGLFAYQTDTPYKITVLAQTIPHLKEGCLDDWYELDGHFKFSHSENKQDRKFQVNHSTIQFTSVDTIGKAKGPKRDILFVNEANYHQYSIYKQLALRTNRTVIIDFNPMGRFWLHEKELPTLDPSQYIFKLTTYKDNPGLPPGKADEIEALKHTDPQLYQVLALGQTGTIKGLIFPEITLVDRMPESLRKEGYGLDFGFTNDPTALIHCGVHSGELFFDELIYSTGLTNHEIVTQSRAHGLTGYADIIADSAEPKSIHEIRSEGLRVRPCKKGRDSVLYGIQLMKKYKINVTKRSLNLIREFHNYKWNLDNSGDPMNKPVDNYNHGIDACRYWASSMLTSTSNNYSPLYVRK